MKQVCIFPPWEPWLGNRLFSDAEGCVYTKAFALWREEAARQGFSLNTCDLVDAKQADILWFMDLPRHKQTFLDAKPSAKKGAKLVLQILESPVLFPAAFVETNRREFDAVVSYEREPVRPDFFSYRLPVDPSPTFEGLPFSDRKLAVMVNTNRVEGWFATRKLGLTGLPGIGGYFSGWKMPLFHFLQPAKGELYSWRRNVARAFEQRCPNDLDLFGDGWVGQRISWCPLYPNHKHLCHRAEPIDLDSRERSAAKRAQLGKYKFVIASENFHGSKGYISEKIFDAILGGSVPVYVGDSNISNIIPEEAFVDARSFLKARDVVDALCEMGEADWNRHRDAGRRFIASNRFKEFTMAAFSKNMTTCLQKILR
jgi:hypothetical protein